MPTDFRYFKLNAAHLRAILLSLEKALSDWFCLTNNKNARAIDRYVHPKEVRPPRG